MTPANALFRQLYVEALKVGDTYDYLPDAHAKYPFIHIGETYDTKTMNNDLMGTLTQVLNVWGTRTQRNELDETVVQFHDSIIHLRDSFDYHTSLSNFNYDVMQDNTTGTPLLRYRIEAEFFYTKKED